MELRGANNPRARSSRRHAAGESPVSARTLRVQVVRRARVCPIVQTSSQSFKTPEGGVHHHHSMRSMSWPDGLRDRW
jgi:hypothetical protein